MSKEEEKNLEETVEETVEEAVEEAVEETSQENAKAAEEATEKADDKTKKDPKDQLIEELQDKNKRQMAEFVNFRNRTEKEMAARYEIGARDVVEKILPVVDNFERGFASLTEEELSQPFAAGMDKIFKQLLKTLEDMDVKAIEAVGQEFDPNLHNAVMHVEDEAVGEGVIIEEFQKGYTYRGNVVRHSMVKVAN